MNHKTATLVFQDCIFCTVSPRRDWGLREKKKAEEMGYEFKTASFLTAEAQEIIAQFHDRPLPYIYADGKAIKSMDELKPKKTTTKKRVKKTKEADCGE